MAATRLAPTLNTTITEQRPFPEQRILVIAENRAQQRTLQRLFSSQGYEVEIVADNPVGLEMLRKRPPSALILDLRYPASVGRAFCREIAQAAPDTAAIHG